MRAFKTLLAAALVAGLSCTAYAELQNVEVGGKIRIRGNWYDFDNSGGEISFVEQRTELSVKADFTEEVKAFIELDSYGIWGGDFRSNYITSFDGADLGNDVDLYQSYIEASEMWGTPLQLRVGRQEISLGNEWLVGVNDSSSFFFGLSFDALRLSYETDSFTVDAIAAKLVEGGGDGFGESDVDFYVLYGSYTALEDVVIDAYWMMVNDDESLTAYDVNFHTVGLRGAGKIGGFEFEAEAAYQFGEAELDLGFPLNIFTDADLDYDAIGANLEIGYRFETAPWSPKVYVGAAYLGGGDQGDNRWWRRDTPELPFNRLFSNMEYSEFLGNTDESNMIIYRAGVSALPGASGEDGPFELTLAATYFQVEEEVDRPWWFFGDDGDDELGIEVGLYADYHYTEDLTFRGGYAHFFGGDGLDDGNNFIGNGLFPVFADEDDDYDYVFVETEVKF